ncbi:hypothetical protein HOLleu_32417 [Holothuria leucospilota]|uniref:Arylamine N-acetyltransferase n=1 Tax=Holothuria leucospilota TaxID=206669 RepID=A0A9Q1BIN4_HOLLE|nr:hypothetical protein HOLleu_32417 [Holothuria leucospilota]
MCFLEDTLQLLEPKKKLERDPSDFLNHIIRQMYSRIPFTNMGNTKDFHSFGMPAFPEMKEAMFKRQGGHCVNFTGFTYLLLQRLGYDSYICNGSHGDGMSNHSAIAVRDQTVPGSKQLVDTGAGVPLFGRCRLISTPFRQHIAMIT